MLLGKPPCTSAVAGFEGMTIEEFVQMHGYSIGTKTGRPHLSASKPPSAAPAAPALTSAVHCFKACGHAGTSGPGQPSQGVQASQQGQATAPAPAPGLAPASHETQDIGGTALGQARGIALG